MGEEASVPMNLDLNLGPIPDAAANSVPTRTMSLEELMDPMERFREVVRVRARQRWRWRQLQASGEQPSLSVDLNQLIGDGDHVTTLQAGEGSLAAEQRSNEVTKTCEPNNGFLQEEQRENRDEIEKSGSNDGSSVFGCNICFDLATEPVVTCCGHLFCWPCLYQWLHVHSDAKECPVCKGEVTLKNLIPIYGRGSTPKEIPDSNLEIPVRPRARRVESLRQTIQRNPFSFPMEEMIRRIGRRFDLARDLSPPHESGEAANAFLSRIMTFRGIRAEQSAVPSPEEAVDLTDSPPVTSPAATAHRFPTLLLRRQQTPPSLLPSFNSAERLVDAYFGSHPASRNHEQPPPVDDRDSFSSVAAVINSESQMDAAVEIDSMVTSSSSRRRLDTSRISDVDTGDSRAPRRRRLS